MTDQNTTTTVDLMRHGEPVGGKRYRGHTDDPLSEKGWTQMRTALADHHPWDVIASSPLRRCSEFAEEIAQRYALAIEHDARLMEIGFGEWEGRNITELLQQEPQHLERFCSDPLNHAPPGAEPLKDFQHRVIDAWDDLIHKHHGKHILLIGHGIMMRVIICHILGIPLARMFYIDIANACLSRIRLYGMNGEKMPQLIFHAGSL